MRVAVTKIRYFLLGGMNRYPSSSRQLSTRQGEKVHSVGLNAINNRPEKCEPIPFEEFKSRMGPFNQWSDEVKTAFPDSTDESLKKIYESHAQSLYGVYKACCKLASRRQRS